MTLPYLIFMGDAVLTYEKYPPLQNLPVDTIGYIPVISLINGGKKKKGLEKRTTRPDYPRTRLEAYPC